MRNARALTRAVLVEPSYSPAKQSSTLTADGPVSMNLWRKTPLCTSRIRVWVTLVRKFVAPRAAVTSDMCSKVRVFPPLLISAIA